MRFLRRLLGRERRSENVVRTLHVDAHQQQQRQHVERRSESVRTSHRLGAHPQDHQHLEKMPVQMAGSDVVCNICARHGAECEIPRDKVTVRCAGIRTVCRECVQQHIRQCVEKSQFTVDCVCIEGGCSSKFTHADLRKHASAEDFIRYDEGLLHSLLEKDPEFCWCALPGCGSGQLHASQDRYPIMRCHACNSKTCFHHHCKWHSGRTCKEYDKDARRSEEVGLLQLLEDRKKFQRCPKCGNGVEKNKGCDHMTCRCKHEFCWRCLAPYGGNNGIFQVGNSAHKKTCHHYRK